MNNLDRRRERLGWWHRWYIFWPAAGLLILAVILSAGCAALDRPYEISPQTDKACFRVHWTSPQEIARMSPGSRAFTSTMPDQFGDWHIYSPMPTSFGDEIVLIGLGEELVHTLGATHK